MCLNLRCVSSRQCRPPLLELGHDRFHERVGCRQGDPLTLIDYLKTMDVGDITIYENDAGYRERGVVELVKQGKIKKIVASHIGTTPEIGKAMNEGRLEVELTPQGTLAEMMRCGGAGLGGFLTPTGIGTVADKTFDGG